MQILVIDHDQNSFEWLSCRLLASGFKAIHASSAGQAIRDGKGSSALAIILDLDGAAYEMGACDLRSLRRAGMDQPLLVLAARQDWSLRVDHLDAGADDFAVKPVRTEEIAARLRAILRRSARCNTNRIVRGDLLLDLHAKCAWQGRRCLKLTKSEFRLLQLLMLNPERSISQDEIRKYLYSGSEICGANAAEVLIARLRQKIGKGSIRTQRGLGYRLAGEKEPGHFQSGVTALVKRTG
jgi:DNA-binding response OmpR family regulator